MIDEKKLIEDISMLTKLINTYVKNIVHYVPTKCDNADEIILQCKNIRKVATSFGVIINNQPKVGEWISCSERLPEEPMYREDSYLVQCKKVEEPFTAYWNGKKWTDFLNTKVMGVVAWMPLPEPYKGESE